MIELFYEVGKKVGRGEEDGGSNKISNLEDLFSFFQISQPSI